MSQKPKKKRSKDFDPKKHRMPVEDFEFTAREFATVGFLQKAIQDAQQAMQHFLSYVATNKWGYADDVKLGFSIDFDNGKVRVEIQRDVEKDDKMNSQSKQ